MCVCVCVCVQVSENSMKEYSKYFTQLVCVSTCVSDEVKKMIMSVSVMGVSVGVSGVQW